jgi:DNA gyrase/topoisomerase IV subunit A
MWGHERVGFEPAGVHFQLTVLGSHSVAAGVPVVVPERGKRQVDHLQLDAVSQGLPSCKNRRMDEDERQAREELAVLDALVRAMDRRDEVFQMIEDSEDGDEARRRVGRLLGVGELGSRAVLDLQARRFTRDQRQAIASRAEELRSKLPDGR